MKNFALPAMAKPYDSPAVTHLLTLKSLLDAVQAMKDYQLTWEPAHIDWFEPGLVRLVESSLTENGEMFRDTKHPVIQGTRFYEGVWIREYMTMPTAVLIFCPYPGVTRTEPLVYTIGVYNSSWVEKVVNTYATQIKSKAI